ncbi:MAG TPA: hypothetical protein VL092_08235, partial [Chitinophagaceae bacterium]|nr:hypothetical protein [Chitinophagaceae bacterium]
MKQLFIITTLCASMNLSAQEYYSCPGFEPAIEKSMTCTQSSIDYKNKYRLQSSYIPWTSPYVDEIVIPINLVVLADDYGEQGAFKPADWTAPFGSSTYNVYAGYYINQVFKSTSLPSDPVPGYPGTYWLNSSRNTKIRIEFNQVYYYNNTEVMNKPYGHPYNSASTSYGAIQKLHLAAHPEAAKFINCYLIKNVYPGAGGEAVTLNDTLSVFSSAWDNPTDDYRWINMSDYMYFNQHLPHELGHHFNLRHTYNYNESPTSGIDALPDVFIPPFTTEQSCPAGGDPEGSATDMCTNNIMSGHGKSWFISPLQTGRVHRTLRTGITRHFAYGTSATPHTITADETWDFTYKSYNSIVIKKGATLTLTCRLEMSKGAKIIIEPGATLVVDGGYITAARSAGPDHEGWWPGIEVWGNDSLSQTGAGKQGKLVTKNGAVIEHAHEAIQVWKPDAWNTGGGIVDCRNTTFRNNRRSCAYYPYHSYNASKTFEYPNKGIFRE